MPERTIHLTQMSATCAYCPHTVSQIDASREHAVHVITEGMERHLAERHGVDLDGNPIEHFDQSHSGCSGGGTDVRRGR